MAGGVGVASARLAPREARNADLRPHGPRRRALADSATSPPGRAPQLASPRVPVPDGKIDGCLTHDQVVEYLRSVARVYTKITRLDEVGKSFEDNPLLTLCVGAACVEEPARPTAESFLNAMHHSRECLSMMALIYTIDDVLTGIENHEPWASHLVAARKLTFWPIINPDGYLWNEKNHPAGFGMQRKNRRTGECRYSNQLGVDLNRNYPICFDRKDDGASSNPCQEDYKGMNAFSEPETQAVKAVVEASNFTTSLNLHSYGRDVLLPFSCQSMGYPKDDDNNFFERYGKELASANHFKVGRPYESRIGLYTVNGDAADWMFNQHGIFAVSPEVGGGDFWLTSANVKDAVHLSTENVPMVLHTAWAAGSYLRLVQANMTLAENGLLELSFTVENAGLWHSFGSVRIGLHVPWQSQPVLRDVGQLKYKYEKASGSVSIPFQTSPAAAQQTGPGTITVSDDLDCASYELLTSGGPALEQLRQNGSDGSVKSVELSIEIGTHTNRFATNSPWCSLSGSTPVPSSPHSENSDSFPGDGYVPDGHDGGSSDGALAWFGSLSDSLHEHPIVPFATLVALAMLICGCTIWCRRSANATYGKVTLGEQENLTVDLEPISVDSDVEEREASESDIDDVAVESDSERLSLAKRIGTLEMGDEEVCRV